MSKNERFITFKYSDYKHKSVIQSNKHSDVDTVGVIDISTMINQMISRGELDKFMREQSLINFRNITNQDLTDEDISILNIKHLDRVDVNTHYNKLRARVLRTIQSKFINNTSSDNNTVSQTPTDNVGVDSK